MLIRHLDFYDRFKSMWVENPEATMIIDSEYGVITLKFQYFVTGTFVNGAAFKHRKYGETTAFIVDDPTHRLNSVDFFRYKQLFEAVNAISIRNTDFELEKYECQGQTIEINCKEPIGFIGELIVNKDFQDYAISNLFFSKTLQYLKRLNVKYILNQPFPQDIPKEDYPGKQKGINKDIKDLINYYEKYSFKKTVGRKSSRRPFMCCDLSSIEPKDIQLDINEKIREIEFEKYHE